VPEVTIKENGREMTVFYPKSKDKGEEDALREFAIEKTKQDLQKGKYVGNKAPPKVSPKEVGARLNEFNQWKNERKFREANHQNSRKYW
jgi:hypothetical protein